MDKHIYGLTKSAEEEAHFKKTRALGHSFEFTLNFDPEVSLGLTFNLQEDGVLVESVTGQAMKGGVEVGDSIIKVCGDKVKDVRSAVKAIGKCDERLIKFISAQVAVVDEGGDSNDDDSVRVGGEDMILNIIKPTNLAGSYDLSTSKWGKVKVKCGEGVGKKLGVSSAGLEDVDLCKKPAKGEEYGKDTIVLARRGKCAMPDKVSNGLTSR